MARDLEKKRASSLAWYYRNRELSIARTKLWRESNLSKNKEHQKTFRETHKQWCHDYQQFYRYGLTAEERAAMFDRQGRCCANVGCKATDPGTKKGWHTDHDHVTGKVRGLLCHHCNVALGKVNDDVNKLKGLIEYLAVSQ